MTDLLVVLVTLAFFAVCAAYVNLCDRVIGPDEVLAGTIAEATVAPVLDQAA